MDEISNQDKTPTPLLVASPTIEPMSMRSTHGAPFEETGSPSLESTRMHQMDFEMGRSREDLRFVPL